MTMKGPQTYPEAEVSFVEFYMMGSEDHAKASCCNITSKDLFNSNRPLDQGIYSLSMGTTSYSFLCKTCLNPRDKCPGHFGSVQLKYPVNNPSFRAEILRWLKAVCHFCGNILGKVSDDGGVSKVASTEGKPLKCKECGMDQPQIYKDPKEPIFLMKKFSDKEEQRLYNDEIEQILLRVSQESVNMIAPGSSFHPSKLILRTIPAIPNNARPDVTKIKGGGRSNNNDITTFLKNIVSTNESIPLMTSHEDKVANEVLLNLLEITYGNMVKDPTGSSSSSRIVGGNGQALASLGSRLRGKEGRIRGNLEGKRIHYAGRTVITGDNNINIDEVGVPIAIAKVLQVPEVVRPYNIDKLMTYFLNKNSTYPGCSKIIKADTKATYFVESMRSDITLEYGDIIYRDMIDGDHVAMNRAPSLLYSAISGHRARILPNGDTFRLSVNVADTLYGGDFDGDAMSLYPPHSIISRNECGILSNLKRWFISYKDRSPAMGVYHDNAISMFEFTKADTHSSRFQTMRLLAQVEYPSFLNRFKPIVNDMSGTDIISLLLPELNYSKKPAFYKAEYSDFIDYNPKETQVEIKRGFINSGRLDKKSLGQGVNDSLFHHVFNNYGVDAAIDLIYNMQQVSTKYLLMRGYTINYDDIAINKDILKRINDITASIIHESNMLTKKYRAGLLTAPIGMTVEEFYEQEQMSILSPGDSFTKVVMESLDHENNNLYKCVASGTKGKPTNILQMSSSIGQMSIKGKRMRKDFGYERALPYAQRFHDDPESVGFIPESFVTGVSSRSAIAQQKDGRNGITTKALSTGITGYHNRKSNKFLEAIIVNNLRQAMKYDCIVQRLCGEDGVDIRKSAYVSFAPMMVSSDKYKAIFLVSVKELPKMFQNETNERILAQEVQDMIKLRQSYRDSFMRIESCSFKDTLMSGQQVLPVNVKKILDDVAYYHSNYINEVQTVLSPIEWAAAKDQLKKRLPYAHFNYICEQRQMPIPDYITASLTLMNMSIDLDLCYKKVWDHKIDSKLMGLICDQIFNTFKKSLVEYGTSIGMIASECTSESMTQRILDSIHASGVSKANFLTRIKEVYGGKKTEQLGDPNMDIFVKEEFADDLSMMHQIANEIEMMTLRTFTTRAQIFFEEYKNITHPKYKHEMDSVFGPFEKHFLNQKAPTNLLKWCIRLEISHATLIEKTMQINMLYRKLMEQHPLLYIVYTDDNGGKIIMRIYLHKDTFKKDSTITQYTVHEFLHSKLLKTVIRGVDGIQSAVVMKEFVPRSIEQPDGSIKVIRKHIIRTSGTNLKEILKHSRIDATKTTCNSIIEIQEMYGIDAARMKLIQCLRELSGTDINIKHYTLIADALTFNGYVSNIEKSGLEESNPGNALLSMSFSHPIQKITEAAIRNEKSFVHSNISSALMLGTTPDVGSNYNGILMNEAFISKHTMDVTDILEAI